MPSPVPARSGFLKVSVNRRRKDEGQTAVHGQVGRASLGCDLCTLRQSLEREQQQWQ